MRRKACMLVADYEDRNRSSLACFLTTRGYTVEPALCSAEALSIVKRKQIDLVLADLETPSNGGLDLLRELKQINPTIRVIVLAKRADMCSYIQAMELGAFEYMYKPVPMPVLSSIIDKALAVTH